MTAELYEANLRRLPHVHACNTTGVRARGTSGSVQRCFLRLCQPTNLPACLPVFLLLQASGSSHVSADLPTKLQYYAACAADEHFPDFTGGLVSGRYSRDLFSPEECRQRHADIISRLIAVFGLQGAGGAF